jgi:hypothetical protein
MDAETLWRLETSDQSRRLRKWLPWVIVKAGDRYDSCGEWAPTIVGEFEAGKRPGRTWGYRTVIEITDADYEKWPEILIGYPGHPDTLYFNIHPSRVYELYLQAILPTLDI